MYKLVVISDIHHHVERLQRIVPVINSADYLVFCGDGLTDLMYLRGSILVPIVCVKGNTDPEMNITEMSSVSLGNMRVLVTHGHKLGVRQSVAGLVTIAKQKNCGAVFFGHTHRFFDRIINGVRIINPGAIAGTTYGTYALVASDGVSISCKECFV